MVDEIPFVLGEGRFKFHYIFSASFHGHQTTLKQFISSLITPVKIKEEKV